MTFNKAQLGVIRKFIGPMSNGTSENAGQGFNYRYASDADRRVIYELVDAGILTLFVNPKATKSRYAVTYHQIPAWEKAGWQKRTLGEEIRPGGELYSYD